MKDYNDLKVSKYQIHCPNCKYEFVWNLEPQERVTNELRNRHSEIMAIISSLKAQKYDGDVKNSYQYRMLVEEDKQIIQRLSELKRIAKQNRSITELVYDEEFKGVVRDRYGDEEYYKILEITKERLKPEKYERMMKERPKG